jgi:uncharacterized protein YecE (DUF72 family)
MGWSYQFWTELYPKGTFPENFLSEYAKHFGTVEVDNTFYRIPSKGTVEKWREHTPTDFLFSAKFPKRITHDKMLRDCGEILGVFLERMSLLQDKLGPLLLQFPYTFKLEHIGLLRDFLSTLPRSQRFVVEVRNKQLLCDELYSLLKENGVGFAIVQQPFMPTTEVVTSGFAYIRLEGDRRKVNGTLGKVEVDRTDDIRKWVERIKKLLDQSTEVFVYFSKFYSGYPPGDVRQALEVLQAKSN